MEPSASGDKARKQKRREAYQKWYRSEKGQAFLTKRKEQRKAAKGRA